MSDTKTKTKYWELQLDSGKSGLFQTEESAQVAFRAARKKYPTCHLRLTVYWQESQVIQTYLP